MKQALDSGADDNIIGGTNHVSAFMNIGTQDIPQFRLSLGGAVA